MSPILDRILRRGANQKRLPLPGKPRFRLGATGRDLIECVIFFLIFVSVITYACSTFMNQM